MIAGKILIAGLVGFGVVSIGGRADAYRPFDGTDAAVADPGEIEVELQPAGFLREGSQTRLVAPATIVTLGVVEGWQVDAQGQGEIPVGHLNGRTSIANTGIFAKHMLRDGVLQGKPGPSIATEIGVLLPELNGTSGTGATWDVIVSEGAAWGAVHLNIQPEITQHQHFGLLLDAIVEGPREWPLRPVAEVFANRDFRGPLERSALVGGIWQVRETLAFDIGVRAACVDSHGMAEVRAGVTFAFAASGP